MQLRAVSNVDSVQKSARVSDARNRDWSLVRLRIFAAVMLSVVLTMTGPASRFCHAQQTGDSEPAAGADTAELSVERSKLQSAGSDESQTDESTVDDPADESEESDRDERIRVGTAGMILLGLIGILGVFGVAFSFIWGGRLRRIVRQDRAEETAYDPLWYLRGKKSKNQSGDLPEDGPGTDDQPTATGDGP